MDRQWSIGSKGQESVTEGSGIVPRQKRYIHLLGADEAGDTLPVRGSAHPGSAIRQALGKRFSNPAPQFVACRILTGRENQEVALPVDSPLAIRRMTAGRQRHRPD